VCTEYHRFMINWVKSYERRKYSA